MCFTTINKNRTSHHLSLGLGGKGKGQARLGAPEPAAGPGLPHSLHALPLPKAPTSSGRSGRSWSNPGAAAEQPRGGRRRLGFLILQFLCS